MEVALGGLVNELFFDEDGGLAEETALLFAQFPFQHAFCEHFEIVSRGHDVAREVLDPTECEVHIVQSARNALGRRGLEVVFTGHDDFDFMVRFVAFGRQSLFRDKHFNVVKLGQAVKARERAFTGRVTVDQSHKRFVVGKVLLGCLGNMVHRTSSLSPSN